MTDRHFHYIVPVWGKEYTELFANVCLPLTIANGNIKSGNRSKLDRFVIVTTYSDAAYLKDHPSIEELCRHIVVEFILVDGQINLEDTHAAMSDCYVLAMRSSHVVLGETYFVFLTPDSFWSEDCFSRLRKIADEGYCVAMAMGLRTKFETIVPALTEHLSQNADNRTIQMDDLVSLALKHLHNMSNAHNWLSEEGFLNSWPSHIYWIGNHDLLLAHCFHLHPLMVLSKRGISKFAETIDGDFLDKLNYPLNKYYIAQGNDDFLGIEISDSTRSWGQELSPPSLKRVKRFGTFFASHLHWHFFQHQIRYTGAGYRASTLEPPLNNLITFFIEETLKSKRVSIILSKLGLHGVIFRMAIMPRVKRLLRYVLMLRSLPHRI